MAKQAKKARRAASTEARKKPVELLKGHPDPLDDEPDEQDEQDDEISEPLPGGKPFGQKFAQWRDNLADDVSKISIYVYKVESNGPNKIPKKVQAYAFNIPRDAEPPETHDIGIIVGSGEFDIIARAQGNEIMRKQITFGPVYDELRAENKAQKSAVLVSPVQAAPVQLNPVDPFAGMVAAFKTLAPVLTPLVGAFAAALNPFENMRRLNAMGDEMAQKSFDFKMKVGAEAARNAFEADDDENSPPVPAARASGWEDKLSDLADLLVWKGREYLQATGAKAEMMGDKVKKKVLNDRAFQALLQDPEQFKVAYAQLCKDCAEIGGAKTVGQILRKLGIEPPVALKSKPAESSKRAA